MYVCRPDHHLAQRDHIGVTELAEEDLIAFPAEFGLRRLVEDAFTAAGIASQTPYEVAADYSIAAGLVRHGLGTIFMPASEAGRFPDLRAVALRPVLVSTSPRLGKTTSGRPALGWPNCYSRRRVRQPHRDQCRQHVFSPKISEALQRCTRTSVANGVCVFAVPFAPM